MLVSFINICKKDSKILKFKENGYHFQQTQNRDVANFHGAVLATDV